MRGGISFMYNIKSTGPKIDPLRDARSYNQGRGESFVDLYVFGKALQITRKPEKSPLTPHL